MKKLFLNSPSDVAEMIGHTWQSKPVRASLWRLLLYAITSGDWNPIHINPFTAWLYKSNLGGLTYCADLVLSRTKEGIHQIFGFDENAEIIASKYESVEFKLPVRVGMKFYYRFILEDCRVLRKKALCSWRFHVLEYGTDRLLYTGIWKSAYCPVEFSTAGKLIFQTQKIAVQGLYCMALATFALLLVSPFLFPYTPMNEYNFPLAP